MFNMTDLQAKAFFHARITQRLRELAAEAHRRQKLWERYGLPVRNFFCRCAYWANNRRLYRTARLMTRCYIRITDLQNDYTHEPWNVARSIYS